MEDSEYDDQGTADVVPIRDGLAAPATRDEAEGMSSWQKVGVGTGVAAGTGLAAFGLYKLGMRLGWWGGGGMIIIDEDQRSHRDPKPSDDKSSGGGGSSRKRAIGKPPNVSGDPEGYNTKIFPHPGPVRIALNALGYSVAYNGDTLVPDGQPNSEVNRFQSDWNKVIHGIDAGKVKLPTGVEAPAKLKNYRGLLSADGIPGKNTLNGLEVGLSNRLKNGVKWQELVKQAK